MSRRIRQRRNRLQASNDVLAYSGKVSLQLKIKDKLYSIHTHNQGLLPMFKLISFAITGKYTSNMDLLPKYIKIAGNSDKTELIEINSAIPSPEDGGYVSRFTALINSSQIHTDIELGDQIYLLSSDISNIQKLAVVTINSEDLVTALNDIKISAGVSGQLEWVIRITNNTETVKYDYYKR